MARRKMPRARYIVVDWNLIQSMPGSKDIPDYFQCIIPAQVYHEIATKETDADKEQAWRKFISWARINVHRLWLGRVTEYLVQLQLAEKGRGLTLWDLIQPRHTWQWRKLLRVPNLDTKPILLKMIDSPPVKLRNNQIADSVGFADHIKKGWGRAHFGQLPPASGDFKKLSAFTDLSVKVRHSLACPREWWPTLATNPNRFAIYRWTKLEAWYCAKRAAGQSKGFANNFDDIHYALLASFTGHLGTNDTGLIEAATGCFPGLAVTRLKDLSNLKVAA